MDSRTNKYNDFRLPFINARHRARVRVVDVFPPEIELFVHSLEDRTWNKPNKKQDHRDSNTKNRWEWGFVLLLEDADIPPNTVSEKLRVVVGDQAGQGLLKENAVKYEHSDTHILSNLTGI
jgi:protection of telomeres protein 1